MRLDLRGKRLGLAACGLSLLAAAAWVERLTQTGLALLVRDAGGGVIASYAHANLDALRVDALLARDPRAARAEWTGFWDVPSPGFGEIVLKSDSGAFARLGDVEVAAGATRPDPRLRLRVTPGAHRLSVVYEPNVSKRGASARREVFLKGVTSDGRSIPVVRSRLFARQPSSRDSIMGWLAVVLPIGAVVSWSWLLVLRVRDRGMAPVLRRSPVVLLGGVLLLAAALRFEALVITYWGVDAPDWAQGLATGIRDLRPGGFEHAPTQHPYEGDPFSYLMIARSMGRFYEPSVREPLFPALARMALILAGGHDIGINFLSAVASVLVCLAIFAVGSRVLSPWAGAVAALLWAIEWQAIVLSTEGWRDDLFTLLVATCASAMLALRASPGRRSAAVLGIAGGCALLTRLSSLSFLVPGLLAIVLLPGRESRRDRARAAGGAALWMLLLAGPFMAACAIGYGDPFYAVNAHASFYLGRAGHAGAGSNVLQLFSTLLSPWEFLETGFVGLTSYPFSNKWFGVGALLPGLGNVARVLALAGLPILLWRVEGIIALIVFLCSIVPYAWTWNIPGGGEWRFTLPVYPLFLLSAAVAVETGVRTSLGLVRKESRRPAASHAARFLATAALLIVSGLWASRWLDWLRVREQVAQRRPALIEPGSQARFFFDSGWTWARPAGKAATATITEPEAHLRLPIPAGMGARVVMRLGSSPRTLGPVEILLGDRRLGSVSGPREGGNLATIEIDATSPRTGGVVELRFICDRSASETPPLALLWVRLEPF